MQQGQFHRTGGALTERRDARLDVNRLARAIHARPGVGVAAHILQGRKLEILRMHVEQNTLIFVDMGIKSVKTERGAARARPGQAILIGGNQTVDFVNSLPEGSHYEARWLVFDNALLDDAYYAAQAAQAGLADCTPQPVRLIASVNDNLAAAFERARQSLAPDAGIPDAVARQRVLEVMHWLLEEGIVVKSAPAHPNVSLKIRSLIAGRLDDAWTAGQVANRLALSEATLRRRLALEGTSLSALLVEARMSTALALLQATAQPVSEIALSVGYESASRFAVRFRARFGFAPTAVRGHERASS